MSPNTKLLLIYCILRYCLLFYLINFDIILQLKEDRQIKIRGLTLSESQLPRELCVGYKRRIELQWGTGLAVTAFRFPPLSVV